MLAIDLPTVQIETDKLKRGPVGVVLLPTVVVLLWVNGGRHWTRTSDLLHVKQVL